MCGGGGEGLCEGCEGVRVGWEASLGCACLHLFYVLLFSSPLSLTLFLPFLQLVIGRFAVSLASVFVRCRQGE